MVSIDANPNAAIFAHASLEDDRWWFGDGMIAEFRIDGDGTDIEQQRQRRSRLARREQLACKGRAWLAKQKLDYSVNEGVHAQTLSAWARELIGEGTTFTEQERELLGIYIADRAVVTLHPDED